MNFQTLEHTFLFSEKLLPENMVDLNPGDFDRNDLELIKTELLTLPDRDSRVKDISIGTYRTYSGGNGCHIKVLDSERVYVFDEHFVTQDNDQYWISEVVLLQKVVKFLYEYLEIPH